MSKQTMYNKTQNIHFEKEEGSFKVEKTHIYSLLEWTSVIFSDEKKLNIDDRDYYQFYWRSLKIASEFSSAEQVEGGILMIRLAVGCGRKTSLFFLSGR